MSVQETTIDDLICENSVSYFHTTPASNPPLNYSRLYINASGDLKQQNSSGTITDVGATATRASLNLDTDDTVEFAKLGINTSTVPHAGTGIGLMAIDGTHGSTAGPHIQMTTTATDRSIITLLPWAHNDSTLLFDSYYISGWRSSDSGSNFAISKGSNILKIFQDSGISPGSVLSWNQVMTVNTSGNVGINDSSPSYKLDVNGSTTTSSYSIFETDMYITDDFGVNTSTVPHAGVGVANLAVDGTDSASTGSHVLFTTTEDNYPTMQWMNYSHDNVHTTFDAYYDGSWRSGDAGSNFMFTKGANKFYIRYDSGIAQGSVVTWNSGLVMNTSGNIGINDSTPSYRLDINGTFRSTGAATFDSSLYADKLGIATTDVPHGTTGAAMLAIDGTDASSSGPHVQFTLSDVDNYPVMQIFPYRHDNVNVVYDAYFDGAGWKSADSGSNYIIIKYEDTLRFGYDNGVAAGSPVTWNWNLTINTSGNVGVGRRDQSYGLDVNGEFRTTGNMIIAANTPAATGSAGVAGELAYDSDYLYIRNSTAWERVALSTW